MIHVAGTKGKGSVTWFIDAFLRRAGARTGRYLSPHLRQIEERIAVAGRTISPMRSARRSSRWPRTPKGPKPLFRRPHRRGVGGVRARAGRARRRGDRARGRLDSTNANDKISAALTAVGLEHTDILGNEVGVIAEEKARIARRGVPLFSASPEGAWPDSRSRAWRGDRRAARCGRARVRVPQRARVGGGLLVDVETVRRTYLDVRLPGPARYQLSNVALAVAVIDDLEARGFVGDARAAIERPRSAGERPGGAGAIRGARAGAPRGSSTAPTRASRSRRSSRASTWPSRSGGGSSFSGLPGQGSRPPLKRSRGEGRSRAGDPSPHAARCLRREGGSRARPRRRAVTRHRRGRRGLGRSETRSRGRGLVVVTGSLYLVGDAMAALESQRS